MVRKSAARLSPMRCQTERKSLTTVIPGAARNLAEIVAERRAALGPTLTGLRPAKQDND